jgi:hypothetical protein
MRSRTPLISLALPLLLAACASRSAAPPPGGARFTLDPKKTTCAEFVALGSDVQPRLVAWVDGYSRGGRLQEQDVGVLDVDRQVDVLVVACEQAPTESFWDKVLAKMPGGSKQVKPVQMTCEEYANLSQTEQAEVAYFADGYRRGVAQSDIGAVDLQRDTATIVVACKPTPKESVWSKIKQAF